MIFKIRWSKELYTQLDSNRWFQIHKTSLTRIITNRSIKNLQTNKDRFKLIWWNQQFLKRKLNTLLLSLTKSRIWTSTKSQLSQEIRLNGTIKLTKIKIIKTWLDLFMVFLKSLFHSIFGITMSHKTTLISQTSIKCNISCNRYKQQLKSIWTECILW